jgi:hypothetical protein
VGEFPQNENPRLARGRFGAALVGLLLRVADERDGVQPDRCDAADARPAKVLMAAESTLSAITVLLIAPRAVNILA